MAAVTLKILLYHEVSSSIETATLCSNPFYTTPLPKLRTHLELIKSMDLELIRLGEWLDAKKQRRKWRGEFVLLAFDGPHIGWFEHVIPILSEMGIPATFFVTSGWVGEKHPYPESKEIKWVDIAYLECIRDLSGRQLFDIGCHSMWHSELERFQQEDSHTFSERLKQEIVLATNELRKQTNASVRSYAPPKGKGNLETLRPFLEQAEIEAVRWASLPGRMNSSRSGLFDLQISYCDTVLASIVNLHEALNLKMHWSSILKNEIK